MLGKDPDYLVFRLKKMKRYLRDEHGLESLGILKKIDGYETGSERKQRRDLVRKLHKIGYSLREIGSLMGLTSQGVNSIIKSKALYKPKKTKRAEPQTKLF